jgi:hypothetical protein
MPEMMNGREIVYVTKPLADGTPGGPSPCYKDMLHYAYAQGYKECDPPGEKKEPETVAPDSTPEDVVGEDNSAAIAEPDSTPAVTPKKSRR